jgi:hypothetical protein
LLATSFEHFDVTLECHALAFLYPTLSAAGLVTLRYNFSASPPGAAV